MLITYLLSYLEISLNEAFNKESFSYRWSDCVICYLFLCNAHCHGKNAIAPLLFIFLLNIENYLEIIFYFGCGLSNFPFLYDSAPCASYLLRKRALYNDMSR